MATSTIINNEANMVYRGTLANNTDLNNVKTRGIYWYSNSLTITNRPPTNYGILEVLPSSATNICQRVTVTNLVYVRWLSGGSWSSWVPEPQIFYKDYTLTYYSNTELRATISSIPSGTTIYSMVLDPLPYSDTGIKVQDIYRSGSSAPFTLIAGAKANKTFSSTETLSIRAMFIPSRFLTEIT